MNKKQYDLLCELSKEMEQDNQFHDEIVDGWLNENIDLDEFILSHKEDIIG